QHLLVDAGMVTRDEASLLECTHPPKTGRGADADALGERNVGHPAVGLQLLKNAPVNNVEAGTHGMMMLSWQSDSLDLMLHIAAAVRWQHARPCLAVRRLQSAMRRPAA